jgi:photosystem II stability/assembly factor-like uncharacterized protein
MRDETRAARQQRARVTACAGAVLAVVAASFSDAALGQWLPVGPTSVREGQVEGMNGQGNPVAGAVHAILADPTDPNVLYAGAVNGGVWKTSNATSAAPLWVPLTDSQSSLSIGALQFDPTDPTNRTLVAGIGRFSSLARMGGERTGLLRTIDGGATWTPLDGGMEGRNIIGVAPRGDAILAAVNTADSFTSANIGIFRSGNGGASFAQVSGQSGSGLPLGRAFELASDPTSANVLYTAIRDAGPAGNGIYKSSDAGLHWNRVSSPAINALVLDTGTITTSNLEMSVGRSGQVYAGVINNGQLRGLFRSADSGATWTQLDTPVTNENGVLVGLQPEEDEGDEPGEEGEESSGQGAIHFSILADPTNANIVYLGGDRQPLSNGPNDGGFPNSIGAQNFTGRLFRVDASRPAGQQAIALTHHPSTLSNSAPHADSRSMTFDAAGNIVEVDDGGVYLRTSPQGTGDWKSLNGNLQVAELHSVAYDPHGKVVLAGTQDIGTVEQQIFQPGVWQTLHQGDGGKVAIDNHLPDVSVRYTSSQFLGGFQRRIFGPFGNQTQSWFPALMIDGSGGQSVLQDTTRQFYTPLAINRINGNLYVGTRRVYESSDRGDTVTQLADLDRNVVAMRAGGRSGGIDNAAVLYVAAAGNDALSLEPAVFLRSSAGGALAELPAYFQIAGDNDPVDVVMDDNEWHNVFVANHDQVLGSSDAGAHFADITGNLAPAAGMLRSLEFISVGNQNFLLAGSDQGVFFTLGSALGTWQELGGTTLPNVPVLDLDYNVADDLLVAGTLGRGAWQITGVSALLVPEPGTTLTVSMILLFTAARSCRKC